MGRSCTSHRSMDRWSMQYPIGTRCRLWDQKMRDPGTLGFSVQVRAIWLLLLVLLVGKWLRPMLLEFTQARIVMSRGPDWLTLDEARCFGPRPPTNWGCIGGLCMPTYSPPSNSDLDELPSDEIPGSNTPPIVQQDGTNQASCAFSLFL